MKEKVRPVAFGHVAKLVFFGKYSAVQSIAHCFFVDIAPLCPKQISQAALSRENRAYFISDVVIVLPRD